MAREASGSVTISVIATVRDTATTRLSTPSAAETYSLSRTVSTGTTDNQADRAYSVTGTLAASGTFDLDLAGSVTDALGQTFTIVEIKELVIANTGTATGPTIAIGAAGTNPLSSMFGNVNDLLNVPPGAAWIFTSSLDGGGLAVSAGSADTIRLTNTSGSTATTYQILVSGRSA